MKTRLAGFVLALALPTAARATVTDFVWTPTNPRLGSSLLFNAIDNRQHSVTSWRWEYRYNDHGCVSAWTAGPSTTNMETLVLGVRPGRWQVRLTVTYAPTGFPPVVPPSIPIVKDIVIPEANGWLPYDGDQPFYGFGVDQPYFNFPGRDDLRYHYLITCNGLQAGGFPVAAWAQERHTEQISRERPGTVVSLPDTGWRPATPDDPEYGWPYFFLWTPFIEDHLWYVYPHGGDEWDRLPVGTVLLEWRQHLRLRWSDPCGGAHISVLGSRKIGVKKTDEDYWQLVEL